MPIGHGANHVRFFYIWQVHEIWLLIKYPEEEI
jgi:hypothetical protein